MRSASAASFLFFAVTLCAQDPPRSAKAILREFDRVAMPSMSDGGDPDSVRRFHQAIEHGCRRKAELAAELLRAHPEHARLPEVLAIRWAGMTNALGEADVVIAELGKLVADGQLRADVGREARRALARAFVASDHATNPERIDAITEVIAQDGDRHEFAASCLLDCVEMHVADPAMQRRLWQVAVKCWPDEPYGGREAARWLHLLDMTGKPFVEQLPAASREWFGGVTKDAADYTVVQVWMGWPGQESGGGEVGALQQLRRDLGVRVRLLGLINGDVAERLPDVRKAGVDWPQAGIADPEPMRCPFGAPKVGFCFLLDRELRVAGVVGRAALLRERIDAIDAAARTGEAGGQ